MATLRRVALGVGSITAVVRWIPTSGGARVVVAGIDDRIVDDRRGRVVVGGVPAVAEEFDVVGEVEYRAVATGDGEKGDGQEAEDGEGGQPSHKHRVRVVTALPRQILPCPTVRPRPRRSRLFSFFP